MAHPAMLRDLLRRYEALQRLAKEDIVAPDTHRKLQDTAYTLCVSTGTRHIDEALSAACHQLDEQ